MDDVTRARIDKNIIRRFHLTPDQLTPDAYFMPSRFIPGNPRDLGCDSLDLVELIMSLEEELHIEFSDDDGQRVSEGTVQTLYDVVSEKLAEVAA